MTWCGLDAYRATSLLRIAQNKTGAGYSIYVLGHVYDHGVWYYFLVTTALKEPLPLLALIVLAAVCRPAPRDGQQETAYLLIPAVVVFLAGSFSIHQLGHRYILPAFPLLVIWVSGLAASSRVARWRRVPPFLVWALVALHVGEAFRIRPNYLAYFNQLIGSPENGYHYLADSNMDWLQDEHVPDIDALRQRWDLVDPDQSPLKLDPSRPPALLLGATDLSGAWAEAGFWGSRFTKLVREKHYRPVAHVGYSRFLFPLDNVGLYQDLYAHVLSRSWVDAENVRRRFATLAGLDEPPLPSFAALRPSDDAPCARGVRRTTMRDGGDEVAIVDGFQPPSPGAPVRLVRWTARWRVEGGDYVFKLPPPGGAEPDVAVSLDGRSLLFVRGSEDKAFRFAAVHLERGDHDLDVSLAAGHIGTPSLEASVVRREPNGLVTGQGVPLEAAFCVPP
jgi:hypothetical protein